MIHTAKLDLEQFGNVDGPENPINLEVWSYWADHGYPVDVVEAYSAVHEKQHEENTAHVVLKVETLSKPIDEADAVADSVEVWCCDCRDYQFNRGVDLDTHSVIEWDYCQHCEAVIENLNTMQV